MIGELIPIIAIVAVFAVIWQRNSIRMIEARRLSGADAETQERLDFTERVLTQVRDAQKLPPGNAPGHTRIT